MARTGGLHRQLILVWIGTFVGAGALAVLELLLLDRHVVIALAGTVLLAVTTAVLVNRRQIAKHHQPLITVWDLRAR